MKRSQYVFRPNLNEPQHRRAWALLQQVPPATGIVLLTVKQKNALKETSDEENTDESADC